MQNDIKNQQQQPSVEKHIYTYIHRCSKCGKDILEIQSERFLSETKGTGECSNCGEVETDIILIGHKYPKPKYSKDNPYPPCNMKK